MDVAQKIVVSLMEKGILIEPSALDFIKKHGVKLEDIDINELSKSGFLTKQHLEKIIKIKSNENEKCENKVVVLKKSKKHISADYESNFEIKNRFVNKDIPKNTETMTKLFNDRYEKIKNILLQRAELKNSISINKLKNSRYNDEVSIISMVYNKIKSKNGNILLEVEDPTDKITVFVKDKKNIDYLITDEVIGLRGFYSNNIFFANKIIFPDVPMPVGNVKQAEDPLCAVFISDLHFGSKDFIEDIKKKFIEWINDPEDKLATKVKYLFIAGDIVDGIGIYPEQENDLIIKDIYRQYELFENFIEKIPDFIEIFICPGNHDAVTLAEPQPPLSKDLVPNIKDFKNVHLVTNPAYVTIHGIKVLMYHGYSFTNLTDTILAIRKYGVKHPQYVMMEVLKKRHLAPLYGSAIQTPDEKDHLVIDEVPDIFHTGDLHSHTVTNYKGITLISSSTFQGQTSFMDRVGHIADPGKITVVDLKTREWNVLKFYEN